MDNIHDKFENLRTAEFWKTIYTPRSGYPCRSWEWALRGHLPYFAPDMAFGLAQGESKVERSDRESVCRDALGLGHFNISLDPPKLQVLGSRAPRGILRGNVKLTLHQIEPVITSSKSGEIRHTSGLCRFRQCP
jgi:hypothetical protein